VSQGSFDNQLAKLRGATEVEIAKPKEGVEVISKRLELTQGEEDDLLTNLIAGKDLSVYGMANAVTALAHKSEDYDRSIELERAGTRVIELPKKDWGKDVLALAA
jgi:precorrin-3B methylase